MVRMYFKMYYFLLSTSTTKKTNGNTEQNIASPVNGPSSQWCLKILTVVLVGLLFCIQCFKTYEQGQRLGVASEIRYIK